jgi:sulfoxide reductase heme-binding subunit YedZ
MNRFRVNSHALPLNLVAFVIAVYVLTQGSTSFSAADTFHPGLESGKWAIRFLLFSLAMTPVSTYLRWTGAIKLRKSAGLWAFGFAYIHVYYYVAEAKLDWLDASMPLYLGLGLYGFAVLVALATTSNRWSMKQLGKQWKRLHRLVYYAGLAVAVHAILATTMSKKMFMRDPDVGPELRLYVGLMVILLVVRIPQVRRLLLGLKSPRRRERPVPAMTANGAHHGPPETEAPLPTVELWRNPNGSFTWEATRESEVDLQGANRNGSEEGWRR